MTTQIRTPKISISSLRNVLHPDTRVPQGFIANLYVDNKLSGQVTATNIDEDVAQWNWRIVSAETLDDLNPELAKRTREVLPKILAPMKKDNQARRVKKIQAMIREAVKSFNAAKKI